jgi:hypothetical protein
MYSMTKTHIALTLCITLAAWACQNEHNTTSTQKNHTDGLEATITYNGLTLNTEPGASWKYEQLELFPITADAQLLTQQASVAGVKTLAEAMQTKGFRIMERKQFGRQQENWFNGLTLMNKTTDTVFVMTGDVVKGGNQDRVNEADMIAMPGAIRNFPVFCVEHGRSSYYNPQAPEKEKHIAAFHGFYSIASPSVRKAVYSGNQSAVWENVASINKLNNVSNQTGTYANMEQAEDMTAKRKACIDHFTAQMRAIPNVVGVVAVSRGKVIGVEMFGHPSLMQRRQEALLHSYAVESLAQAANTDATTNPADIRAAFTKVARVAEQGRTGNESVGKSTLGDAWLHLYQK